MKQISLKRLVLISTVLLGACGPQGYGPSTIVSEQTAAGGMNLAPKVDIVLSVSQSGGMNNIQNQVGPAIQQFISNLQQKGWDYRFVGISLREHFLSNPQSITGVVAASRFHTNYPEANWLQPYPGATYLDSLGNPNPLYLMTPSLFSSSVIIPSLSTANNDGRQPGLLIQSNFLNRSDVQNDLLRSDALLAVITITNERDTSAGWTTAWNGQVPNSVYVPAFTSQMQAAKSDPSLLKYYSIVAQQTGNCVGSVARVGQEYITASQLTGGQSYNLCSSNSAISTSLNGIAQHLQQVTLNYKKDYLVLQTEPDTGTIKVYKNGSLLPESATNGWTYVGYLQNQPTVFYPTSMSQATGYMIKLNGTAILTGNDKARVEYMNDGAQYSH